MDDTFTINVDFRGTELDFEGRLHLLGYNHKIELDVYGTQVFFEPDEDRNYRAIVAPEQVTDRNLSRELLKAIAERLESLLKS